MSSNSAAQTGGNADLKGDDNVQTEHYADTTSVIKESAALKYETLEEAKIVLADDKRKQLEADRKHRVRENEARLKKAKAAEEQARKEALQAEETADQYTIRLANELKYSVIKRYEVELYETMRIKVEQEFEENTRPKLLKSLKAKVYEELYNELEPVVWAELSENLCHAVKLSLTEELRPIVEEQIHEQILMRKNASLYPDLSQHGHVNEQASLETGGGEAEDQSNIGGKQSPKRALDEEDDGTQSPSKRTKLDTDNQVTDAGQETAQQLDSSSAPEFEADRFLAELDKEAHEKPTEEGDAVGEVEQGAASFRAVNADEEGEYEEVEVPKADDEEDGLFLKEEVSEEEEEEKAEEEKAEEVKVAKLNESDSLEDYVEDEDAGKDAEYEDEEEEVGGEFVEKYQGKYEEDYEDEDVEEEEEEVEPYGEDYSEEDVEEGEDDEGKGAPTITAVNTQETAFVIDSDEEDAEKTLVETEEVADTKKMKAIYDGAGEEEDEYMNGAYQVGMAGGEMEVEV